MKINREKGQTLIEVLAAFSVAITLLFGITTAVIYSLNGVQFTKYQNLANQYAQQGMEVVKNIWNSDLTTFNNLTGNYCLYVNSKTLLVKDELIRNGCTATGQPNPTPLPNAPSFAREINITKYSPECQPSPPPPPTPPPAFEGTHVKVKVSWTDNKCTNISNLYCHKVELVSCLSKINTLEKP